MKQSDIYTEALTCLRSILLADHPEFQNWIDWLERDIQDWNQQREVAHHPAQGHTAVGPAPDGGHTVVWAHSMICPVCVEITTIFSTFSSPCAMPSAIFMPNGKAFLRRY